MSLVIDESLRKDVTTDVVDTGGKFAVVVYDPSDQFAVVHLELQTSPKIFEIF